MFGNQEVILIKKNEELSGEEGYILNIKASIEKVFYSDVFN